MHLTPLSPNPEHYSTFSTISQQSSTISPFPKSLSSLCLLWEQTHHNNEKHSLMPNICHQFTSPDKLLTGHLSPPGQYSFTRVASDMFQGSSSRSALPMSVLPAAQGVGRSVGLAGVGLGVLTILFIVIYVTCMKRKKNIQVRRQR